MNEIELARTYLQTLLEIERATQAQVDAYQQDLLASLYRHAIAECALLQGLPRTHGSARPGFTGMEKLAPGFAP